MRGTGAGFVARLGNALGEPAETPYCARTVELAHVDLGSGDAALAEQFLQGFDVAGEALEVVDGEGGSPCMDVRLDARSDEAA